MKFFFRRLRIMPSSSATYWVFSVTLILASWSSKTELQGIVCGVSDSDNLPGLTSHKQREVVCGVVHICMYIESYTAIFSTPKIYMKTASDCFDGTSDSGVAVEKQAVYTQCAPTEIVLPGHLTLEKARHLLVCPRSCCKLLLMGTVALYRDCLTGLRQT